MKKITNLFLMTTLAIAFVACQNEILVEEVSETEVASTVERKPIKTLQGVVNSDPETRAQIVLGNQNEAYEKFYWNERDSFTVYKVDGGNIIPVIFYIDENYNEASQSGTANFYTYSEDLYEGDSILAIYPSPREPIEDGNINIKIEEYIYLENGGSAEDWKNYFSRNMYMIAKAEVKEIGTAVNFKHITSLIRISYTNQTNVNQNINKVSMCSPDEGYPFGTDNKICIQNGYKYTGSSSSGTNMYFFNLNVSPNETKDFYFLQFECSRENDDASIIVQIKTETQLNYSAPIKISTLLNNSNNSKKLELGKRYWFNLNHEGSALFWKYANIETTNARITNTALISAIEEKHNISFQKDNAGYVDLSNIYNYSIVSGITSVDVSNCSLTSLDGIQYFTNLNVLSCSDNSLTELNLSNNPNLLDIYCYNNNITTLDLRQYEWLPTLDCHNNKLTSLLINAQGINNLDCSNNELMELDLSKSLNSTAGNKKFNCSRNHLSSLDVSNLYNLDVLYCGNQTDLDSNPQTLILKLLEDNPDNYEWIENENNKKIQVWEDRKNDPLNSGVIVEGYGDSATGQNFGNGGKF